MPTWLRYIKISQTSCCIIQRLLIREKPSQKLSLELSFSAFLKALFVSWNILSLPTNSFNSSLLMVSRTWEDTSERITFIWRFLHILQKSLRCRKPVVSITGTFSKRMTLTLGFSSIYNTPGFSDQWLRWFCCGKLVSERSLYGTAETVHGTV